MAQLLSGVTAVVTGAARGIGLAIARGLGEHGSSVVLVDRDGDAVKLSADELAEREIIAIAIEADVTDLDSMRKVMDRAVALGGRLDVVVNNAGIVRDGVIWNIGIDDFDAVVDVNLKGAWIGTKVAVETMRKQSPVGGAIVNVSSIAGKSGNIGQTNYSAAKAGI